MKVYILFRVTITLLSFKRIILDSKGNPCFVMVTGNHGGLPLQVGD